MNKTVTKTVVELPIEEYQLIRDTNEKILHALQNMKVIATEDYLSRKDFMAKCGIGHSTFTKLHQAGKLKTKKVGKKKTYVLSTEVQRFFRGELSI